MHLLDVTLRRLLIEFFFYVRKNIFFSNFRLFTCVCGKICRAEMGLLKVTEENVATQTNNKINYKHCNFRLSMTNFRLIS